VRWILSASAVALAVLQPVCASDKARPGAATIAAEVTRVFKARCAACHGSQLAAPKGRFGYVLDLGRLATNPELVVPDRPEESELLALIEHDEMPPPGALGGPLALPEKAAVRAWIAAGAPAGAPTAAVMASNGASAAEVGTPTTAHLAARALRWTGKLHLLLLHAPIAFAVAAALAEAILMLRGSRTPSEMIRVAIWIAAGTAVPTACLGWLFAATAAGAGPPGVLTAHRWFGVGAAAALTLAAIAMERDVRRGRSSGIGKFVLLAAGLATTVAGHFGGLLARGADFFVL